MKVLGEIIKRRNFYKNVKFADIKAKKYLYDPIFYFATQYDFLDSFENITNYVSHATALENREGFNIKYPVTLSGMSISKIKIEDANKKEFEISLQEDKILYYEKYDDFIEFFIANLNPDKPEERFGTFRVARIFYDL